MRRNFGDLRSITAKFLFINNHANILDPETAHMFLSFFFFFVYITPEYEILAEGELKLN